MEVNAEVMLQKKWRRTQMRRKKPQRAAFSAEMSEMSCYSETECSETEYDPQSEHSDTDNDEENSRATCTQCGDMLVSSDQQRCGAPGVFSITASSVLCGKCAVAARDRRGTETTDPCTSYSVDLGAAEYGMCKCGFTKERHGASSTLRSYSEGTNKAEEHEGWGLETLKKRHAHNAMRRAEGKLESLPTPLEDTAAESRVDTPDNTDKREVNSSSYPAIAQASDPSSSSKAEGLEATGRKNQDDVRTSKPSSTTQARPDGSSSNMQNAVSSNQSDVKIGFTWSNYLSITPRGAAASDEPLPVMSPHSLQVYGRAELTIASPQASMEELPALAFESDDKQPSPQESMDELPALAFESDDEQPTPSTPARSPLALCQWDVDPETEVTADTMLPD